MKSNRTKTSNKSRIVLVALIISVLLLIILIYALKPGSALRNALYKADFSKGEPLQQRENIKEAIAIIDKQLEAATDKAYKPSIFDFCQYGERNFGDDWLYGWSKNEQCRYDYERIYLTNLSICDFIEKAKSALQPPTRHRGCNDGELSGLVEGQHGDFIINIEIHKKALVLKGIGLSLDNDRGPSFYDEPCAHPYCVREVGDYAKRKELLNPEPYSTVVVLEADDIYHYKKPGLYYHFRNPRPRY